MYKVEIPEIILVSFKGIKIAYIVRSFELTGNSENVWTEAAGRFNEKCTETIFKVS